MRDRQLNSVVLPAPLGPIRPTICPSATSKVTLSRATIPPKRTVRSRTERITEGREDTAGAYTVRPWELSTPARVGGEPTLPEILLLAHVLADPPAEHEEQIAQPVHVAQRPLAHRLDTRQREHLPLRAPAHRPGLVQETLDAPATGQDERLQRRQIFLTAVHDPLELGHLALAHPEHPLVRGVGGRGQLAAEVEELVLHLAQRGIEPLVTLAARPADLHPFRVEHAGQPHHRVQLVDGAVGDDAR